jgi:hypothetical protein
MTSSQGPSGASRVSRSERHTSLRERAALGVPGAVTELAYFEMGLREGQVALDATRHKSENYELRAKAAEATLIRVRTALILNGDASYALRIIDGTDGKIQ